jgi:hypothetical protein
MILACGGSKILAGRSTCCRPHPLGFRRGAWGLPIHFTESLVDNIRYARVDGKNRLQLKKTLPFE